MKKKIILISSVTVITAAGLILFLVLSKSKTYEEKEIPGIIQDTIKPNDKFVAAKSGLNLRSDSDKSSKIITLIPFGTKVAIEKSDGNEIFLDGRYGKWVNVKFANKIGWVFSGFLCDFKPDTVIKPAAAFYRDKYRKSGYS